MKDSTRLKLKEAEEICIKEGRSLEYMIEFMPQYAKVSHDCVMNYLYETKD
jgi:hypothetical protein